jgi:hypothetical protein
MGTWEIDVTDSYDNHVNDFEKIANISLSSIKLTIHPWDEMPKTFILCGVYLCRSTTRRCPWQESGKQAEWLY